MKKHFGCAAVLAAALLVAPLQAFSGDLRLSIANGRVTIVAQDVTVKQILDEWQRVGQTVVVGAERVVGPPITIELYDVSEGRALESLLRSASGYIAKPRGNKPGASVYDQIMIMPASRAPAVSATPPPFVNRAQPQVVMPPVVDDDEPSPPIAPPGAVPAPPQQFPGQPPPQPGMQPGMQTPMTSPRPGQLPPPAPIMPGNPYQPVPPQPRPPGGTGPGGVPGGQGPGGQVPGGVDGSGA
jgi:hypothetical protein